MTIFNPGGLSVYSIITNAVIAAPTSEIIIDVSDYDNIIIEMINITASLAGVRAIQLSVDNGATYFSGAGDYAYYNGVGVLTNNIQIGVHATGSAAARGGIFNMNAMRSSGAIKPWLTPNNSDHIAGIFNGSNDPVTNIRCFTSAGDMTAGQIIAYGI